MRIAPIKTLVACGLLLADGGALSGAQPATNPQVHWAFIAPDRPSVPAVKNKRWVRNPIDAFVLARLEKEQVSPSPEADRATLIRRLHLDLLGLPPEPEAVRKYLADQSSDAYERLVDSLLASPHFGERWARHWLDLARYADTSGYQIDRPRPYAWLYRDWVIDAINDDLPFDQFTVQQLAGDLLPNATIEQKTAAGFHRLTLMNHEDGTDPEEFRCKAKVDRVSTTGTVWIGLTVGCAECHNHKYDPISQREFYQLYAFFNNCEEVEVPAPQADDPARFEREKKAWETEQARLKGLLTQTRSGKSTPTSSELEKAPGNSISVSEVKRLLARHRRSQPKSAEAKADSFQERAAPAQARIHIRGDFLRPGEVVSADVPTILPPLKRRGENADRLDLARWIADPANPLTARVAVNHVWQHLFGRGLVNTPEDFGTRGEPPSHPELLDWLAVAFSSACENNAPQPCDTQGASRPTQHATRITPHATPATSRPAASAPPALGWSRKALIKLIVTSATYRQSSRARLELLDRDPQNVLLARQNRLRVEAEILRDLCLAVGNLLNDDLGGPSFRPHLPDDVKKLGAAGAFSWTDTEGSERYRRGLYIFAQRTVPYPTSMTFDQADPTQTCTRRDRSNTPLQALTLLNHGLFVECAQALGKRLLEIPAKTQRDRLHRAFELCLARPPTKTEMDRLEKLYGDQLIAARAQPAASAKLTGLEAGHPRLAELASLIALSQVLLNLDEFMTRE